MAQFSSYNLSIITFLIFFLFVFLQGVVAATFTFVNKCDYTVWPGVLTNPGSSTMESTGFQLTKGDSRSFQAPAGWAGRFWGRTGCSFDDSGHGSCTTGDCGSGEVECNGAGAIPPATLAEFTLGSGSQDFYDVSLVDGYNLPMIVEGNGGSGDCATTGCVTDLNKKCPSELKIDGGDACKSACDAFGTPDYCCSGVYSSPTACKPSMYSEVFKSACPKSYSYAFDDATSTFTCTGADYTITFCPNVPSLKSSSDPAVSTSGSTDESGSNPDPGTTQEAALASQWLANLAIGDSTRTQPFSPTQFGFIVTIYLIISLFLLSFNFPIQLQ